MDMNPKVEKLESVALRRAKRLVERTAEQVQQAHAERVQATKAVNEAQKLGREIVVEAEEKARIMHSEAVARERVALARYKELVSDLTTAKSHLDEIKQIVST